MARRSRAEVAKARAAAEELLWRRYNIVGDLIQWAAGQGTEATEALFDAVMAARSAVMNVRADPPRRFAAEDALQRALNAYYAAGYADDWLMAEHEVVMILAHLTKADGRAFEAAAAHDRAAAAFQGTLAARVLRMAPTAIGLTVAPAVPATSGAM